MEQFAAIELKLNKNVNKGDEESLLTLFSAEERFRHMEVLTDMDEGAAVKVVLEGLGEITLELGDDMEKGRPKTIMTLFWYSERSKPIKMIRDAKVNESISMNILVV
jgi:hypothetical protein